MKDGGGLRSCPRTRRHPPVPLPFTLHADRSCNHEPSLTASTADRHGHSCPSSPQAPRSVGATVRSMLRECGSRSDAAGGIDVTAASWTISSRGRWQHALHTASTAMEPSINGPARLGRRGRAGQASERPEPGAGSAGPGAAERRRLIFSITKDYSAAYWPEVGPESLDQRVVDLVRDHRLGRQGSGRDSRRACSRDSVKAAARIGPLACRPSTYPDDHPVTTGQVSCTQSLTPVRRAA